MATRVSPFRSVWKVADTRPAVSRPSASNSCTPSDRLPALAAGFTTLAVTDSVALRRA